MATVVYQGFQSHFESQHFEPRSLRLRLSSPNHSHLATPLKSHFIDSTITPQDNTNAASLSSSSPSSPNSRTWSFLESLSNTNSKDNKEEKPILPYIQPPSSRRTLSDESLALCTESLGSETGSNVINDQDLFLDSYESKTIETRTSRLVSRQEKKMNVMASLPPPLTSMRGFDCIQVKSHREDGRLVMTATKPPPRNRCLQERSDGCVRIAFLIDSDEDMVETEIMQEEESLDQTQRDNEETEHNEEVEEEMGVNGVETIQRRRRRCNEKDLDNRGFLNWESFCVATS
ncbi:unnamed protein product [Cochlearia groenlandica]